MAEKTETGHPDAQTQPVLGADTSALPVTENNNLWDVDPEDAAHAYRQDDTPDPENGDESVKGERDVDLILDGDEDIDVSRYDNDDDDEIEVSRFEDDSDEPDLIAHKRVLLVEDERDVVEIITEHLKSMNVRDVNVVNNVGAAYFLITRDKELFPDIVLLELALPGTDGIQLLARLRAHKDPAVQNLPAVVITMLESPGIYRRAARQKVGAFLKKPISKDGLRQGMEDALKGMVVEQPFSQPKSWLDELEEDELRRKREEIRARADAKIKKKGFLVRLLHAVLPWSDRI